MVKLKLYHGTNISEKIILDEGLKVGNNSHGGTHGIYELNRVCLTEYLSIAEKYGSNIIIVEIDEGRLHKDTDRDGQYYYSLEDISEDDLVPSWWFEDFTEYVGDLDDRN